MKHNATELILDWNDHAKPHFGEERADTKELAERKKRLTKCGQCGETSMEGPMSRPSPEENLRRAGGIRVKTYAALQWQNQE